MSIYLFIFFGLFLVSGLIYAIIMISYSWGWLGMKRYQPPENRKKKVTVSVIVPARNEEATIGDLLKDLYEQDYPKDLYEVVVIDDSSADNTFQIVLDFREANPEMNLKLIRLKEKKIVNIYKKKAITIAIQKTQSDLIITTDADTRQNNRWISTITSYYEENDAKMIVGPVSYHKRTDLFEKLQTLEFLSLIATSAGAIKVGKPIMCNGANLAYEREAFYEVGGFGKGDKFASGDDVFLLLKIKDRFGSQAVHFLKSKEALVLTHAKRNLKELYDQRLRWSSKSKGYKKNDTILGVAIIVFLVNFFIVTGFLWSFLQPEMLQTMTIIYFSKFLIDLPILIGITGFVNRYRLLFYGVPLLFIYPLYIIAIGALGRLIKFHWKGRKGMG